MPNKMDVSQEEAAKIKAYRKTVQDKNTDRRLYAVQLRGEGKRNKDIAEMLEADPRLVSKWVRQFLQGGIEALVPTNKGGRPPRLTFEEEEALLNEFKESAEKMAKELSSRYYERQVAADVDKLVTNKALGYGLKVNNLSIQSSKEPVALLAYANSEAWALKERAMEAAANAEAEEKDSSTDKKSDKEDKKSDKKDKDSSEDDSKKASEGMVDIETIASINNEEGIYNVEDTTGADVYATTLMLDVYGPHDKAQAMLDEIIANKSFRVLSYQWSESTEFPYEYVDGELVQVVQENSDRLIINFDMYMYDGSAFKALTEGIVNDETTDEDSTEASTDISE